MTSRAVSLFVVAFFAAQAQLTEIVGVVKDPSGGVLPGVTITLSGSVLPRPQNVGTGQDGTYRLTNLPDGSYTVMFQLTGFERVVRAVTVSGNGRLDLGTITLKISALTEPNLAAMGLKPDDIPVSFETSLGIFMLALDGTRERAASDAFLKHIDAHFYDGGSILPILAPDDGRQTPGSVASLLLAGNPTHAGDSFRVLVTADEIALDSGTRLRFGRIWRWRERSDVVGMIVHAPIVASNFSPPVSIVRAGRIILLRP